MSLYVRVLNGFYTHRKTIRLRLAIGDAAFWVPPRLWAYASENQPDGCFKQYSEHELAMLIGYSGDAKCMLEALLGAGFMDADPLRIHDWDEHNGYHATYADRAKKGAAARWSKSHTPPDLKVPERKGKEASIASGMLEASQPAPYTRARNDVPSWEEFWGYCQIIGMAAEWYAKDKYLLAEQDNWDRKGNWQAYATRIKTWWEGDGRPMHPKSSGKAADGQPRPRPKKPHVDAEWIESEWRWV